MMNKKKKIIFAGLFFAAVFVLGIYLYPGDQTAEQAVSQKADSGIADEDLPRQAPSPASSPLPSAGMDASAKKTASGKNPYVHYPENLLTLLGIDMEKVIAGRDKFKNSVIHVEWMDHVNDVLKNLDPEKKEAIIQNHTSLLYIKDLLNEAYLSGKIDHETFVRAVADLMKWHQKTFQSMLTGEEYEALFEVKPEAADDMIDDIMEATPRYSFILNQQIPAEEVTKQVQGYKLEEVDANFRKMILDREQIGKKINAGEMTLEEARQKLYQSQQEFISKCKQLLSEDEINTIFGSMDALETGGTQTQPPAVLGDSDKQELGFEIENPDTSIDMVKEKVNKNKLDDIKFFYQQREKEREALIGKLDAGEITSESVENVSNEMDSTFKENCRSVLTDEEYNLIFEQPGEAASSAQTDATPENTAEPGQSEASGQAAPEPETTGE